MKPRFFVVFSQVANVCPKLYKRQAYALKMLDQSKENQVKEFEAEEEANIFYQQQLSDQRRRENQDRINLLKKNLGLQEAPRNIYVKSQAQQQASEDSEKARERQEKEKEVNQLLQKYKIFKSASFSSSKVVLSSKLNYSAFCDGCSLGNPGRAGVGYLIKHPQTGKEELARSIYIGFRTGNLAELTGFILAMADCYCNGVTKLNVHGDSQLTVNLLSGKYNAKLDYIADYVMGAKEIAKKFETVNFKYIARTYNMEADSLSKAGAKKGSLTNQQKKIAAKVKARNLAKNKEKKNDEEE